MVFENTKQKDLFARYIYNFIKPCLVFIFALFPFCAFSVDGWILKKKYEDTAIYLSANGVRLTVRQSRTEKIKPEKINVDFIQKIEQDKKRLLESIGVTNWNLKKTSIVKKTKNKTVLKLFGSYNDPSGEQTYFVEYHHYNPSRKLQILLTHPHKKQLLKDARRESIKQIEKEYGF